MRALVLRDFYDIAVEERPEPQPRPGEVVVAGDRHRHLRLGLPRLLGRERAPPPRPGDGTRDSRSDRRAGLRGSRARGRPAGHRQPGDVAAARLPGLPVMVRSSGAARRVVLGVAPEIPAAFADRVAVPGANIVPLPETTCRRSWGRWWSRMAVGYHAYAAVMPRPEDRVLVIGGGPIGQACLLAARRLGVKSACLVRCQPVTP